MSRLPLNPHKRFARWFVPVATLAGCGLMILGMRDLLVWIAEVWKL